MQVNHISTSVVLVISMLPGYIEYTAVVWSYYDLVIVLKLHTVCIAELTLDGVIWATFWQPCRDYYTGTQSNNNISPTSVVPVKSMLPKDIEYTAVVWSYYDLVIVLQTTHSVYPIADIKRCYMGRILLQVWQPCWDYYTGTQSNQLQQAWQPF